MVDLDLLFWFQNFPKNIIPSMILSENQTEWMIKKNIVFLLSRSDSGIGISPRPLYFSM